MDEQATIPTDEQLLQRFAAGDDAALGKLADRHERNLIGLASGLLCGSGREELARDAVQDAWVRVIRHARKFDGKSTVLTWIYRIVINRCSDLRSAAASRLRKESTAQARTGSRAESESRSDPADAAARGAFSARVQHAVSDMDPGKRLILLLCYHRGLTHTQVADVLEIPIGTLKSRLSAALAELRQSLAEDIEPHHSHAGSHDAPSSPLARKVIT